MSALFAFARGYVFDRTQTTQKAQIPADLYFGKPRIFTDETDGHEFILCDINRRVMSSSKGFTPPTGQTPRFCYTIYTTIRFFYFTFCDYTTKITHTGMIVKRRSSNYRYVSRIITVFNILITILRETEHPKRVDPGQTHRSVTPEGTISIHRNTEIY